MAKVDDLLNYSGRWAEYEVSRVVATNNKSETQRIQLQGWASDWLIHQNVFFQPPMYPLLHTQVLLVQAAIDLGW